MERTNGESALNARSYDQKLYALDAAGELVARPANRHGAAWLPDDEIPESLDAVVALFFEEMWPVLADAAAVLTRFIESEHHERGAELPGKTFTATPGFEAHQTGDGALTHAFRIGGVPARRMVVPYQIWMLQRVEALIARCVADASGTRIARGLAAALPPRRRASGARRPALRLPRPQGRGPALLRLSGPISSGGPCHRTRSDSRSMAVRRLP